MVFLFDVHKEAAARAVKPEIEPVKQEGRAGGSERREWTETIKEYVTRLTNEFIALIEKPENRTPSAVLIEITSGAPGQYIKDWKNGKIKFEIAGVDIRRKKHKNFKGGAERYDGIAGEVVSGTIDIDPIHVGDGGKLTEKDVEKLEKYYNEILNAVYKALEKAGKSFRIDFWGLSTMQSINNWKP